MIFVSNFFKSSDQFTTSTFNKLPSSNPNLLDNWYFVGGGTSGKFPINQRSLLSYDLDGSIQPNTIDRWKINPDNDSAVFTINSNSIHLQKTGQQNWPSVNQFVPISEFHSNCKYTISALISGNASFRLSLSYNDFQSAESSQMFNATSEVKLYQLQLPVITVTSGDYVQVTIAIDGSSPQSSYIDIVAMKFELGSAQTLSYQSEDGSWTLNDPPPNYEQELSKCCRYQQILNSSSGNFMCIGSGNAATDTNCFIFIPTPVTLRTSPTISYSGELVLFQQGAVSGNAANVTSLTNPRILLNGVTISCGSSGLVAGQNYQLWGRTQDTQVILDANL